MAYYRKHHGKMSECGHAMFASLAPEDIERLSPYGGELYGLDTTKGVYVNIDTLLKCIAAKISEDYAQDALSGDLRDLFADSFSEDVNAFAQSFAPEDIINSAGAYDNLDMVVWLWDRILDPAGIAGVLTEDGAVSWEPEHIFEIRRN